MLEQYLEQYVEELYKKSNIGLKGNQYDLYSKEEFYKLLKPVIELFKKDNLTLEEMREQLYIQSGIETKVDNFINKREMAPGMVFRIGTKNYEETIIIGNRQEVKLDESNNIVPSVEEMTEDTIFDLASITKLFTSLSILKLVQDKSISLNDEIIRYVPKFKKLKGVTIFDLLSFRVPLKTNGRIDKASTSEEAEKILFDIEVNNVETTRPYTDMGAMVLKYVIEEVSGMNYYQYVKENILDKLNMKDTHIIVPKMKLDRVASTNLGVKYYKDGNINITTHNNGTVYDEKAQILLPKESGHAGMFSTVNDMSNLSKGIIGGQVIDEKYVRRMAKNRIGRKYIENNEEKYVQYLGYLCYAKNPCYLDTEVFHAMSGRTFASAGWTGTQLTVDPINEIYFFMAGNRSHNRMTYIDPVHRDKVSTNENNKKTIVLPNGKVMTDSTRYAWDRCYDIINPALSLSLQYKMLEDLYELINEKIESDSKTRKM